MNNKLLLTLLIFSACSETRPVTGDTGARIDAGTNSQDTGTDTGVTDTGPVITLPDHCEPGSRLPGCPCASTEEPIDCYDGSGETIGTGICHAGERHCIEYTPVSYTHLTLPTN